MEPIINSTTILLILGALATYRLTRLITADQITLPLRTFILDRNKWLGYLVTCDWCLSVWFAPLIAIQFVLWPTHWMFHVELLVLSFSAITGLVATIEQRIDR